MPWENIETRLAKPFSLEISFPDGIVILPTRRLDIDDWLTSAAETDEELRELDIPRIRFLQNRWRLEKLVEFDWEADSAVTRRALWALYIGRRAYLLFSGGFKYHLIAALEPSDKPALYQAVIRRLLGNPDLVPTAPTHVKSIRCDLIANLNGNVNKRAHSAETPSQHHYLSDLLVGWIGPWITVPVSGYWHEDEMTDDNGETSRPDNARVAS